MELRGNNCVRFTAPHYYYYDYSVVAREEMPMQSRYQPGIGPRGSSESLPFRLVASESLMSLG